MTRQEILAVAKPILFNTEMVRAILDGRKTVTRRPLKLRYKDDEYGFNVITNAHTGAFVRVEKMDEDGGGIFPDGTERYVSQPAYKGDILYVRETWTKLPVSPGEHFRPNGVYYYKADGEFRPERFVRNGWRPSIHMPKEAARLFLRVTDVRVERLQDITDKQIENEGIRAWGKDGKLYKYAPADSEGDAPAWPWAECPHSPKGAMKRLWDSTIKPADMFLYGWDANPWVWVIEFEEIKENRNG